MFRKSLCLSLAIAAAVLLAFGQPPAVRAVSGPGQTAKLFVGAVGTSTPVFRYEVGVTGIPTLDLTLTDPTFALPGFFAFSPAGELFVMNNLGGPSHRGSISRFLDPAGTPVFNGSIESGDFASPHWATFRDDELFVGQSEGDVLRFVFGAGGAAMPNGVIPGPAGVVRVNPATGELFVPQCCSPHRIDRYLIDALGNAVPNGSITGGGLNAPHDLAFSPWGELFAVNGFGNSVSRFVFDAAGNASPNGLIVESSLNIPLGADFSPWGELFVANRNDGLIHRWVFDASFNATFNGVFQHVAGIHDLQFAPSVRAVEIDIKPGSDPNGVNVSSGGVIPVAVLSAADFDASSIDPSTVTFGPAEAGIAHTAGHIDDVNGDGYPDLLLHFDFEATGIACGDTSGSLTGKTYSGQAVAGADSVQPVPCR